MITTNSSKTIVPDWYCIASAVCLSLDGGNGWALKGKWGGVKKVEAGGGRGSDKPWKDTSIINHILLNKKPCSRRRALSNADKAVASLRRWFSSRSRASLASRWIWSCQEKENIYHLLFCQLWGWPFVRQKGFLNPLLITMCSTLETLLSDG